VRRNRKEAKSRQATIQVWTYDQACRVLPYVASIMRSLREHRLEAQQQRLASERLANAPGRPDRNAIIAHDEAVRLSQEAEDRFQDALEELHVLDIYCMDALQGLALIPFAQGEQLAWFVFNLFDEGEKLRFWRYHEDPLETRRPIIQVLSGPKGDNSAIV
jgi:hypothetical protein